MVTKNSFGPGPTTLHAADLDATAYQAASTSGPAPLSARGLRGRSPRERGGHPSLIG